MHCITRTLRFQLNVPQPADLHMQAIGTCNVHAA